MNCCQSGFPYDLRRTDHRGIAFVRRPDEPDLKRASAHNNQLGKDKRGEQEMELSSAIIVQSMIRSSIGGTNHGFRSIVVPM